ncbi:hypothetical protein IOC57_16060 [Bacillus sp. SD075]|uniref:hypothetical protein n=1 Tax=Bacillus sp. SD075 TaxID=2781732 RepID=UPI001A9723B5|nr:hypothetical protein [Bacillus sp. SD075]MBO0999251.1 hypothetical protein [Bacillus sp. SD075]
MEVEYHPSLWHTAFQVSLEDLKSSVACLEDRGYAPRGGLHPIEPFVMPHGEYAHAKIHFSDRDGNRLDKLENAKF